MSEKVRVRDDDSVVPRSGVFEFKLSIWTNERSREFSMKGGKNEKQCMWNQAKQEKRKWRHLVPGYRNQTRKRVQTSRKRWWCYRSWQKRQ